MPLVWRHCELRGDGSFEVAMAPIPSASSIRIDIVG